MIQIVKADGQAEKAFLSALKTRSGVVDKRVTESVTEILETVRAGGDKAVMQYTEQFDGVKPACFEVSKPDILRALETCNKDLAASLKKAAENIREFHARQVTQSYIETKDDGSILGRTVRGLEKVGIYVPGGTAAYPSSVLMNAIPAKIAGVGEIIMVTPPLKDGSANINILAAAAIAGVDRVFLCGGAQAVAALAYGTESVPKVDKIVGPGNIFVATAKRIVYGTVDIDMIAGPSEILIIADETANPRYLAADLMSQAEHDLLASAILVTTSMEIAEKTAAELEIQSKSLSRCAIIEQSFRDFGAIVVFDTLDGAIDFANQCAPEHLEISVDEPMRYLSRIENAGSVFLGEHSPEPLGDYFAGPNHVLPTSGTARFFSPLSVDAFVKKSNFIYYSKEALQRDGADIIRLAEAEGLTAHANSIAVRMK